MIIFTNLLFFLTGSSSNIIDWVYVPLLYYYMYWATFVNLLSHKLTLSYSSFLSVSFTVKSWIPTLFKCIHRGTCFRVPYWVYSIIIILKVTLIRFHPYVYPYKSFSIKTFLEVSSLWTLEFLKVLFKHVYIYIYVLNIESPI